MIEQECGVKVEKEYKFHPKRRFKFDYAIVDLKIAIEQEGGVYNGKAHGSVSGILRDIEKYTLAGANGWIVLRFLPEQMFKNDTINTINQTIQCRYKDNFVHLKNSK